MVVPVTIFLGILFPLVNLYVVFIILFFLVRLVGTPMKYLWNSIFNLV